MKATTMRARTPAIYTEIGERIQDVRVVARMTQAELANRCDIRRTSLSMMEAGQTRTSIDVLLRIARVLDVPYTLFIPVEDGNDCARRGDTGTDEEPAAG